MRLLKRTIAFVLAVSMAVPTNLVSMPAVHAEEKNSHAVSIEQSDHGSISLTEDSLESISLKEGEKVSVDMHPEDGYKVSEFIIKDSETNDVIVDNETEDDHFEFDMPDYDITITGRYANKGDTNEQATTEIATENAETTEDKEIVNDVETTETNAVENAVFDHYFNEIDEDIINTNELFVQTSDSTVFTKNTNIVSNYDDVYIISCDSVLEARCVYSYYIDKVDYISDMSNVMTLAEPDPTGSETVTETDNKDAQTEEQTAVNTESVKASTEKDTEEISKDNNLENNTEAIEEKTEEQASSEEITTEEEKTINSSDDVISNLNEKIDELDKEIKDNEELDEKTGYEGYIALIDTGVLKDSEIQPDIAVSVIDEEPASEKSTHGTKMLKYIKEEDPEAKVMSIKAFDGKTTNVANIYAAFRYAIEAKVSIINMSFVGYDIETNAVIKEIIKEATDNEIVLIGAAGNGAESAMNLIPGCMDEAITVGAVNEDGTLYVSSNYDADTYVVAKSTSEAAARFSGIYNKGVPSEKVYNNFIINGTETENVEEDEMPINIDEIDINNLPISDFDMIVKYTYIDNKCKAQTIDDVFTNEEEYKSYIAQTIARPTVYETEDYYLVKTDIAKIKGISNKVRDVAFANGNDNGEIISSGVYYDKKHNIACFQKNAFEYKKGNFSEGQMQLLIPINFDEELKYPIEIEYINKNNEIIGTEITKTSIYDNLNIDLGDNVNNVSKIIINNDDKYEVNYTIDNTSLIINEDMGIVSSIKIYLDTEDTIMTTNHSYSNDIPSVALKEVSNNKVKGISKGYTKTITGKSIDGIANGQIYKDVQNDENGGAGANTNWGLEFDYLGQKWKLPAACVHLSGIKVNSYKFGSIKINLKCVNVATSGKKTYYYFTAVTNESVCNVVSNSSLGQAAETYFAVYTEKSTGGSYISAKKVADDNTALHNVVFHVEDYGWAKTAKKGEPTMQRVFWGSPITTAPGKWDSDHQKTWVDGDGNEEYTKGSVPEKEGSYINLQECGYPLYRVIYDANESKYHYKVGADVLVSSGAAPNNNYIQYVANYGEYNASDYYLFLGDSNVYLLKLAQNESGIWYVDRNNTSMIQAMYDQTHPQEGYTGVAAAQYNSQTGNLDRTWSAAPAIADLINNNGGLYEYGGVVYVKPFKDASTMYEPKRYTVQTKASTEDTKSVLVNGSHYAFGIYKQSAEKKIPLAGAKFVVYKDEGGVAKYINISSGYVEGIQNATQFETTGNGVTAYSASWITGDTHYAQEVVAPTGYILDGTPHAITMTKTSLDDPASMTLEDLYEQIPQANVLTVENPGQNRYLAIKKVDAKGNALNGVKFVIDKKYYSNTTGTVLGNTQYVYKDGFELNGPDAGVIDQDSNANFDISSAYTSTINGKEGIILLKISGLDPDSAFDATFYEVDPGEDEAHKNVYKNVWNYQDKNGQYPNQKLRISYHGMGYSDADENTAIANAINNAGYGQITNNTTVKINLKKKTSSVAGCSTIVENNPNYSLAGAEFKLYNNEAYALADIQDTSKTYSKAMNGISFTTDADGNTGTVELTNYMNKDGNHIPVKTSFWLVETKAPKGYKPLTQPIKIEVEANKEEQTFPVENTPKYDNINLTLKKEGVGEKPLSGATFRLNFYALDVDSYNNYDQVKDKAATRSWIFETKADGTINITSDLAKADSGSSEFYTVGENRDREYPLGVYTLVEESPADGYQNRGFIWFPEDEANSKVEFNNNDETKEGLYFEIQSTTAGTKVVDQNGTEIHTVAESNKGIKVFDIPNYFGFKFRKNDADYGTNKKQGDAPDLTTIVQVINKSGHDVTINGNYEGKTYGVDLFADGQPVLTFITDKEGNYVSTVNTTEIDGVTYYTNKENDTENKQQLQAGTYEFKEITPPTGYLNSTKRNGITTFTFPNGTEAPKEPKDIANEAIYDFTNYANQITNPIKRGGFAVEKIDFDKQRSEQSGDAPNLEATFELYNRSASPVKVDTDNDGTLEEYAKDAKIMEFTTTKANALNKYYGYISDAYLLPYGSYQIVEKTEPTGYLNETNDKYGNAVYKKSFTIGDEQQYHIYGKDDFITDVKAHVKDAYKGSNLYTEGDAEPTYETSSEAANILTNEAYKGSFALEKWDADDDTNNPQGDSESLKAQFELINMSDYSVVVDVNRNGILETATEEFESAKNGDNDKAIIMTFWTDDSGRYIDKTLRFLPYGTYKIKEITPAEGYLNDTKRGGVTEVTFRIRKDKQVFVFGSEDFKKVVEETYKDDDKVIIDHQETTTIEDPIKRGRIRIKKNDADMKTHKYVGKEGMDYSQQYESKYAQGDATLNGAVYHIYNKSKNYVYVDTNNNNGYDVDDPNTEVNESEKYVPDDTRPVYVLTTGHSDTYGDGFAETPEFCLPYGTYDIVEVDPSTGYLIEATRRTVTVAGQNREDGYDRYGVKELKGRTIREEGGLVDLTYDTNLMVDEAVNKTHLEQNTFFEPIIRGGFDFRKCDEETLENKPLGGANLKGKYKVVNQSKSYVWVDKNENGVYDEDEIFAKGETVFEFETDAHDGRYQSADDLLPYGTYDIVEVDPPEGYLKLSNINPNLTLRFVVREEGKLVSEVEDRFSEIDEANDIYNELHMYNFAVRGDIYFDKKCDDDAKSMGFIPFKITSLDQDGNEIESHIVFTDTNGYFNSSAAYASHEFNTNLGDKVYEAYLKYYQDNGKWPDEDLAAYYKENGHLPDMHTWMDTLGIKDIMREAGVDVDNLDATTDGTQFPFGTWFGVGTKPTDDLRLDATGAFPYGHYKIEELRCAGNEGYVLYNNAFEIAYDASSRTVRTQDIDPHGWRNGEDSANVLDLGTIYNYPQVTLSTEALVQDLETHYCMPYDEMVIVDHIYMHDIPKDYYEKQGYKFKLVGQLMYADTAVAEPVLDADGNAIKNEIEFDYLAKEDNKKMEFDHDATGMEGRTLVVYETLYMLDNDEWVVIGDHKDKDDTDQQIHFPKIETLIKGDVSEYHLVKPEKGVSLTDKVTYENLEAGKQYYVSAYLMDADTEEVAKDDNGKAIKADKVGFKPTEPNGEVNIKFNFDAETLGGKTYVSFVEVTRNRNTMALKAEITDVDETIKFPVITTKALDLETGTQMSFADNQITVVDTVEYSNVFVGDDLTFKGTLIDKATGEPLKVGDKEVTAEASIKAEAESGTCDVTFVFDGTGLEGKTLVAFESMHVPNGAEVAEHRDLEDADDLDFDSRPQTIYIPKIGTTAVDKESKLHMSDYGQITITDTVAYENIIPGMDYLVVGKLLDQSTREVIVDDVKVGLLKPESSSGTVDVEFTFDGTQFEGKTVVAFEDLYVFTSDDSDEKAIVARHADIHDEAQAVHIPKVRTTALDKTTKMHITKAGEATVIDTVSYENVLKDVEYTVKGKLVYQNGDVVKDKDGKEITAETTFTATTEDENAVTVNGEVDVVFEFDATDLAGTTLVAYEYLMVGDYQVGHHEDPNDEAQTIHIPKITTTALDSETEDHIANADELVTITDKVDYENVLPGHTYTMTGYLVDKETGEEITLLTEEEVEAIRNKQNGEEGEDNNLDELNKNKYYEVLKAKDGTIYYHVITEIIVDDTRRIAVGYYKEVGDKFIECNPDGSDKNDGEEYETIINKIVQEGNRVSITFVAEGTSGSVELPFNFSGSALKGRSVVAFEEMFLGEYSIAEHKDQTDEGQTVVMPELHTTATDKISETHYVEADETVTVVDKVEYKNVLAGKEYKVRGVLYDKTKDELTGITAEATFTAESTEGTVDVEFVFNGNDYAGGTYVAFEELYYNEKLVGEHKDKDDIDQTIHVIRISTTATDDDTKVNVAKNGKITIRDTVAYEGLVPGESYVMSGILMKKVAEEQAEADKQEDAAKDNANADNKEANAEAENNAEANNDANADENADADNKDENAVAEENNAVNEAANNEGVNAANEAENNAENPENAEADANNQNADNNNNADNKENAENVNAENAAADNNAEEVNNVKVVTYKAVALEKDTNLLEDLVGASKNYIGEQSFVPDEANGTVDVTFEIDVTDMDGESIVVFEKLFFEEKQIAHHEDVNDEAQTVHVPKIGTTATDIKTEDHISEYSETATIKDVVAYENLVPGIEYTVKGELYDKETGKSIEVTGETTFTPEEADGTVDVLFTFDSTVAEGRTFVAYEWLYVNDVEVADHTDIEDVAQTIKVVKLRTNATGENETQFVEATGTKTITDKVTYENLILGKEYTVKGTLYDKETNNPLTANDGSVYMAETTFTAEEENGSVDMVFTVDAEQFAGKHVVVFEDLYYNEIKVGTHADINDKDQTIYIIKIGTQATDENTKINVAKKGKTIIVDEVSYEGLLPGESYVMSGKLMNKATGKELTKGEDENIIKTLINGITGKSNEYISEVSFVPEEPNGKVTLKFEVDTTDLKNNSVVVFEKLFLEEKNIANHEDINDEDQTVHVPDIGTRLTDKLNGNKDVSIGQNTILVDTVDYKNLVPGKVYRMEGKLMDKEGNTVIGLLNFDKGEVIEPGEIRQVAAGNDENAEADKNNNENNNAEANNGANADNEADANKNADANVDENKDAQVNDNAEADANKEAGNNAEAEANKDANAEANAEADKAAEVNADGNAEANKENAVAKDDNNKDANADAKADDKAKDIDVRSSVNKDPNGVLKTTVKDDTVYVEFMPTKSEGSLQLEFEVNTTKLYRKHIVAFEKLFYNDVEIATHEDLEDTEQAVFIPDQSKIGTVATDKATGTHMTAYGDKTIIVDTVNYENLVPGIEYTLKGSLMPKALEENTTTATTTEANKTTETATTEATTETNVNSGTNANNTTTNNTKAVAEATATFTPTESNGSTTIEFTVDTTTLANSDLVAFEELYIKDELVAEHKDMKDEAQTVHNAGLKTTATVNGKHEAKPKAKTELIDKVEYSNLVTGQEYIVKGVLMDKKTGKPVKVDKKEVQAETKFTAEKTSGSVEMKFNFDSTKYSEVVVFEDLYINDVQIASHSDLNDENQTVTFKKESKKETKATKSPEKIQTGEAILKIVLSVISTIALAGLAIFLMKKRKIQFK